MIHLKDGYELDRVEPFNETRTVSTTRAKERTFASFGNKSHPNSFRRFIRFVPYKCYRITPFAVLIPQFLRVLFLISYPADAITSCFQVFLFIFICFWNNLVPVPVCLSSLVYSTPQNQIQQKVTHQRGVRVARVFISPLHQSPPQICVNPLAAWGPSRCFRFPCEELPNNRKRSS